MLTKKDTLKGEVKSSKAAKNSAQPQTSNTKETTRPAKAPTQQPAKTYSVQPAKLQSEAISGAKGHPKTRVTIKYDVGFANQLFIRGKGANLNWEKGQLLVNTKPDEWIWETDANFNQCEFKVLINDQNYEGGDNHLLNAGATLLYTPYFSS